MSCGYWSAFVTTPVLPPRVLTSEGGRRAYLKVRNIRVEMTDLLIDVTLHHDYIGASRSGLNQGQLRNPDNSDHILESAAADKIRTYRDPYQHNRQADDYFAVLEYQAHKEEFCHRRGVFFHRNRWRCVAPPPPRVTMSLHLATCPHSTWPTTSMLGLTATSTSSTR